MSWTPVSTGYYCSEPLYIFDNINTVCLWCLPLLPLGSSCWVKVVVVHIDHVGGGEDAPGPGPQVHTCKAIIRMSSLVGTTTTTTTTMIVLLTVSTTQTNFLIYSEAAYSNLYIRKCFQMYKILPYIRKFFQIYKFASLPPYILGNLSEFVLTVRHNFS